MVLANATISYGTHYTPTIQEEIVESSRMQLLQSYSYDPRGYYDQPRVASERGPFEVRHNIRHIRHKT